MYDGERTGGTNSRDAAGAHRPLLPAWTPGGGLSGLDARPCAHKYRRPHAFRAPLSAVHSTRGQVSPPCSLDALGLRSARCQTRPTCPRLRRGARACAPTSQPPRWGTATSTATGCALPAVCEAAPPGDVPTLWAGCDLSGCGWTPCPAVPLRFARCRAAPNSAPVPAAPRLRACRLASTAGPHRRPATDDAGQFP